MAIYTGVADENGDFTVPFSSNYTGGQKVTVTAEKDGAEKTIELHAPSEVVGGGAIEIDGDLNNFPLNINNVTLSSGISGTIQSFSFRPHPDTYSRSVWLYARGLKILGAVTRINSYAFYSWISAKFLILPATLVTLESSAFAEWTAALSLVIPDSVKMIPDECFYRWAAALSLDLPASITSIGSSAFAQWTSCDTIICRAIVPPSITSTTFTNLKSTCFIKVPNESVAAYKAAANWSEFASRIQAI